jgi:UDP-2-acetamido-2,6-beta-L-arabino-hexul-4-ose reductase
MTWAITGGDGFLGWHLRCRLRAERPDVEPRILGRRDFDDIGTLADALAPCDVIFHLAAANSHDPEVAKRNVGIAEALVGGLDRAGHAPHVVYSNTSHSAHDSPYGRAKRTAAEYLRRWAERSGTSVADVILPNLFGECGRPHYNSVIATLCDAVVSGAAPAINPDGQVELLHGQAAAWALLCKASDRRTSQERLEGHVISIPALYDRLARFHEVYAGTQNLPLLATHLDLQLFNQLRAAMFPSAYPMGLRRHTDRRGSFFEAVRASGKGQTSFSTTVPSVTRGDHWHFEKIERFLVLRGSACISVRRLFSDTVHRFEVSGDEAVFVDMPTLHTHNITNTGDDELLTMFWASDHFDPAAPDTYPEPVELEAVAP